MSSPGGGDSQKPWEELERGLGKGHGSTWSHAGHGLSSVPAVPVYRGGGWGSERVRGSPRSHSWWVESRGLVPPDPASVIRVVIITTYWELRGSISIINFTSEGSAGPVSELKDGFWSQE